MNDKNVITISNNQDWSLSYGYGNKNHVHHTLIALHGINQNKCWSLVMQSNTKPKLRILMKNTHAIRFNPFFFELTTKGNFEKNGDKM